MHLKLENTVESYLATVVMQTHFLFTPYLHPVRPAQQSYNQAHIHTRGLVEHMFGIWKNRFQCLRNTYLLNQEDAVLLLWQLQCFIIASESMAV
ncbi:hypothetical protein GOODEAATRI_028316 [Goodea atripinnis]|uniref:DDE Tnp4 domain-containing protein n=1 Tax=Goodea atripinnis TaxID=208336 RepID=A0ABV0NEC8_9TELE